MVYTIIEKVSVAIMFLAIIVAVLLLIYSFLENRGFKSN